MQDRIVRQLIHALEYAMKDAITERLSRYPDKTFEPQGLIFNTVSEDVDKEVYTDYIEKVYLDSMRELMVIDRVEYQHGGSDTDVVPFEEFPLEEQIQIFEMLQI